LGEKVTNCEALETSIGILIETVWGQMFHFWKFSQNTLGP
jgi:hypothetical protein